jgi:hypothetical protein
MLDLDALLSAIRAAPQLTGARCVGHAQLFDEQPHDANGERNQHRAQHLCSRCPALAACQTWLATLPPSARPLGVVAGQIGIAPPKRKQHKPSQPVPLVSAMRRAAMRRAALAAIAEHERAAAQKAVDGRSRSDA